MYFATSLDLIKLPILYFHSSWILRVCCCKWIITSDWANNCWCYYWIISSNYHHYFICSFDYYQIYSNTVVGVGNLATFKNRKIVANRHTFVDCRRKCCGARNSSNSGAAAEGRAKIDRRLRCQGFAFMVTSWVPERLDLKCSNLDQKCSHSK